MLKHLVVTFFILISIVNSSASTAIGESTWKDIRTSFSWLIEGSVEQFKTKNNLYYLGAAFPTTWYAFEKDQDNLDSARRKGKAPRHIRLAGDFGVVLSFPVVQASFYAIGRNYKNEKAMQFAMEYVSSMYLALAESGVLSFVQIHHRPDKENLSSWETGFRGDSSFPSGHVIPYYGLFFKTLQFYGPYWAVAPAVLSLWAAQQRVRSARHYTSDVVGSFFLMAFASEGVRKVAKYKDNHPFYKWAFEHEASISVIRHDGVYGPAVVWNY